MHKKLMDVTAVPIKFVTKIVSAKVMLSIINRVVYSEKYNLGESLLTHKCYESGRGVWQEFRVRLIPW